MSHLSELATDARQSPYWRQYLAQIGWKSVKVKDTFLSVKKVPHLNHSIIKVTHPDLPLPFQEIENVAKAENSLFVLIEPHVRGYTDTEFIKNGYQKSKMRVAFSASRLIDIASELNAITQGFSENARRNIKKAKQKNVRTSCISGKDLIDSHYYDDFYNLYCNLGKMKHFYCLPHEEMSKKVKAFEDQSFACFAYLPDQSDPIAVVWFVIVDKTLIYMHTGITQQGYDNAANYLLVEKGIEEGKKRGCIVFDFESIYDYRYPKENKKWLGYSEFKSRFHGEVVLYPQSWVKIYNPLYKALYLCASIFS